MQNTKHKTSIIDSDINREGLKPLNTYEFSRILFFLFLLSMASLSYAQRFHGGLKGGLTATEVSGDQLAGPTKPGFYASVFTFTSISSYAFLQLEIKYIQKGSRAPATERNIQRNIDDYRFSLQYVEVPVYFIYNIARFTDQQFFESLMLYTGVSASFLVSYHETRPQNPKRDFHPAEANILLGFSYPLNNSLDFKFGFSQGVSPIRPHASGNTVWYNWGQYNTVWTFGLSYVIW